MNAQAAALPRTAELPADAPSPRICPQRGAYASTTATAASLDLPSKETDRDPALFTLCSQERSSEPPTCDGGGDLATHTPHPAPCLLPTTPGTRRSQREGRGLATACTTMSWLEGLDAARGHPPTHPPARRLRPVGSPAHKRVGLVEELPVLDWTGNLKRR